MKRHFAEQRMRGQCQAGQLGRGRRLVLVRGQSSSHLCLGLSSVARGVHILGLSPVPWKLIPQVRLLESRMLNLPPSPQSTRVTCIVLEAQLFHWLTRGPQYNEGAIHRLLWKWESKLWADVGSWLAGSWSRDCIIGSWERRADAELCV